MRVDAVSADSKQSYALLISIISHGLMLILLIFGLPHTVRKFPDQELVVAVVNASVLSQRSTAPERAPVQSINPAPNPPVLTPSPPKPEPKPEPLKPTPPQEVKPLPKPEPPKPVIEPKPEAKKPPPKPEVKKPVPEKPIEKKAKEPLESTDDFASSILKNIEKAKPAPSVQAAATPGKTVPSGGGAVGAPADDLANQLSGSELDTVRQQIGRCWNFPAGAKNPEELIVTLRVVMNPDRTVRTATILNSPANPSLFYTAASESAVRALFNPRCTPLALPPQKFNEWKTFTIRFDPRQMVGL
ncbi:MAG: cell envelope integrity protein TolA [Holosporales bacterium]|jgi:outer membrane biosynthesis protein TonB